MALNWMEYGFTKAAGGTQHFLEVVNPQPGVQYRALCGQSVSGSDKVRSPDWEWACPGCYREARIRAGQLKAGEQPASSIPPPSSSSGEVA